MTLPTWATFTSEDPLDDRALEQTMVDVSTRKYHRSLELLAEAVE